jgi:hypothetical protein
MPTVDDVALAAIAANAQLHIKDAGVEFDAVLHAVQELRNEVLADTSATTASIVRHHMYVPVGPKTMHCFYERIQNACALSFYVTGDVYEAESMKPMDLAFVGSYPTTVSHVN